jgi:hypothetical protein
VKAKTIHGNSPEEITRALEQSVSDGFAPTLAIVFISIKQDRSAVCAILKEKNIDILGATSSGEFTEGHQSEGAAAIMLLDIPKAQYSIFFESIGEGGQEATARLLGETARATFSKPAIIFCSTFFSAEGIALDGETLMRNIEDVVGAKVNIFGGMAGDDLSFSGTYVFSNNDSTDHGLVALIVDADKIAMQGMAISGWKPMGISRTITKSEGNLIYTIDDKPALETYMRFLGGDISTADDNFNFFDSVGVHYPFQIERENREPMMCNPIGYDREKEALITESNVAQGTKFRFSTPPDFDIVETVVQKAKDLKSETNAKAEALLIFSCVGRLSALGPMAQQENEGLHEIWNAPMAGFYTYGEFGRAVNGKHEFHSTTCCWVALSEK